MVNEKIQASTQNWNFCTPRWPDRLPPVEQQVKAVV